MVPKIRVMRSGVPVKPLTYANQDGIKLCRAMTRNSRVMVMIWICDKRFQS